MDASAQAASGMLYGLRYQLGSFDGCLAAAAASPVGARYCLVSLQPLTKGATTPPGRPAWETVDDLHPDEDVAGVLSVISLPRSKEAYLFRAPSNLSLSGASYVGF